jgi:mRNA-degrading endonuclease RelE of RelBE toxin-antitoxin system
MNGGQLRKRNGHVPPLPSDQNEYDLAQLSSGAGRRTSTISPFLSGETIFEAMRFASKGNGSCCRDSNTSPSPALPARKHPRFDWTDEARADIRALDRDTVMRISDGLYRFAVTGEGDVKALQGKHAGILRPRLGDYRIFFRPDGRVLRILP